MGGLFGKKKKKPALDQSEKALLDCKMVRDKIKGYIKTLERNEKLKKTKAKESLREKKKDRAKMLLKLAKMYGEQIKASDNQLTMIEDSTIRVGDPIRVFLYDEHPFKFNDGYQKYGKQQAIFYIEKIDRSISPANVSTMTLTLTAGRVMGMESIYDKMYLLYKDYFTEPDPDELPFGYEEVMSSLDSSSGSSGSSGTSSGQSWDNI